MPESLLNSVVVVIGGSAGALEPLRALLSKFPSTLPASVLVVIHTSSQSYGALPEILDRRCLLPVAHAQDGEPLVAGRVYVAPVDRHLTVATQQVRVTAGPRENGFRPAVDPLFRSAARYHGPRSIGVVLSGALDDGTFGLLQIKRAGGTAVVQHPEDSLVPSMPTSALRGVEVDHIAKVEELGPLVLRLTESLARSLRMNLPDENLDSRARDVGQDADRLQGSPSALTCPECGGALWEMEEHGHLRFRCHTGHGYTAQSLLADQRVELEHALWSAIRVLKERAMMHRRISENLRDRSVGSLHEHYAQKAEEEERKADLLRSFLENAVPTGLDADEQLRSE